MNKIKDDKELIQLILSMIPTIKASDYIKFNDKITQNNLFLKFEYLEQETKSLHKIKNFPVISKEELIVCNKSIFTNKKINNPARTLYCLHIECLELEILYAYILKFKKCPLCSQNNNEYNKDNLGVDSIYLDKLLKDIFSEVKYLDYIIINKYTCKYRVYDPLHNNEEIEYILQTAEKTRQIQVDSHLNEIYDLNNLIGEEAKETTNLATLANLLY